MDDHVAITAAHAVLPGRDVPGSEMTNADLSGLMAQVAEEFARRGVAREVPISTPEFPQARIGIHSRRVLDESLSARDLAVAAADRALRSACVDADNVRCVVVSTVTSDRVVPSIATTVHDRLGLPCSAPAFDLRVGCNGFLSALDVGHRFLIGQPEGAAALVVGAETMIRVLDASDRATCSIFGDGGGVVVLQRTAAPGMAAVRQGWVKEFVAVDADERSLEVAEAARPGVVKPVAMSVGRLLARSNAFGRFDMVYSAGLYDYLEDRVARRLTKCMFSMLEPGGRLMFSNFLPGVLDAGYMETYMGWQLIYRDLPALERLLVDLPDEQIAEKRVYEDPFGAIGYVEVLRR